MHVYGDVRNGTNIPKICHISLLQKTLVYCKGMQASQLDFRQISTPLDTSFARRASSSFSSRETFPRVSETELQQPVHYACAIIAAPGGTAAKRRHRLSAHSNAAAGHRRYRIVFLDQISSLRLGLCHRRRSRTTTSPSQPESHSSTRHSRCLCPLAARKHASIRAPSDILAPSLSACSACPWPCLLHPAAK